MSSTDETACALAGLSFMKDAETKSNPPVRRFRRRNPALDSASNGVQSTSEQSGSKMEEDRLNQYVLQTVGSGLITRHFMEEISVHHKLLSEHARNAIEEFLFLNKRHLIPLAARLHLLPYTPSAYFDTARRKVSDLVGGGPEERPQDFWKESLRHFKVACEFATTEEEFQRLQNLHKEFTIIYEGITRPGERKFFAPIVQQMVETLHREQLRLKA